MERTNVVVIPESEWKELLETQKNILELLRDIQSSSSKRSSVEGYITAMEFMQAVRIGRTKFDQLVGASKVKTIKKDRKIYVPMSEVERYFLTC